MDLPLFFFLFFMVSVPAAVGASPKSVSNITVIGSVFCDFCANSSFSKHSYFLHGAKVRVECSFRSVVSAREEISISVERTTDRFGVYRVDVPPVDDFQCREGREMESFCRAKLVGSSSPLCNVPGLGISSEHVGVHCADANFCVYNLNALFYRPAKRDNSVCGGGATTAASTDESFDSSLFFWPPFPPFGLPWPFPHWPPFPFPFPFPFPSSPPSFPFPWRSPPPSFPFPWPSPPQSIPFPWPSPPQSIPFPWPPPPSFPFPWPSPPSSNPFPFVPPPSPFFPFPFPPSLLPSPPPPPPSFRFPFPLPPPLAAAPPPPPPFSLINPRTWFRFPSPPSPNPPADHP